ncbi:unnamed protein product [Candidula unifasciata]|uniref:Voltage-gated hydrogen channel 1 n=1 Tax=Candidula unifasciata TaxID=100452 RepID=A0A8S3ZQE6_9EUPU|nr:unnamed protein product [Candidula unifasciata]
MKMSCDCDCLHNNIVVESLVVVLTLVSGLAITGENLIVFNLITVPQHTRSVTNITGTNNTAEGREVEIITENNQARSILNKVFHYVSLGIAGLFFIEIVLKVCSLQKRFIINPWQIFDTLVVIASLTLELTFHFVYLGHRGLYSLTYVVLFRLWRIPMLCNTMEASEYDLELYRNGRIKAEDRCRMLETTLTQRNETIRKLEKMLRDLTGAKQLDLTKSEGTAKNNGHLPHKTYTTEDELHVQMPSLESKDRQAYSVVTRGSHRYTFPGDFETEFMSTYDIESSSGLDNPDSIEMKTALLYKQISKKSQILPKDKGDDANNSSNSESSAITSPHNVDNKSTTEVVTNSVLSAENISTCLARRSRVFLRSRKRRSSASEILDYINLSSPSLDSMFGDSTQNPTSVPNSDIEKDNLKSGLVKDKLITKDVHESVCTDTESKANNKAGTGDTSAISPQEHKTRQIKRRTRRFASCPEYVFTQRMNITNDESMLIGDGHPADQHFGYNNLAFNGDDNLYFPVISEYGGSTTYRNEDGIPMTSL